jgi:hypothetical protein
VVGTKVVTTASLLQALLDSSRPEAAARIHYDRRLLLAGRTSDVYGKEKVYGSIP